MDVVRFIEGSINDPLHHILIGSVFEILTIIYYYSNDILDKWAIKSHDNNNKVCYNENGIPIVQKGYEPKIEKEYTTPIAVTNTENIVQTVGGDDENGIDSSEKDYVNVVKKVKKENVTIDNIDEIMWDKCVDKCFQFK